jgi:hypothetical protein
MYTACLYDIVAFTMVFLSLELRSAVVAKSCTEGGFDGIVGDEKWNLNT